MLDYWLFSRKMKWADAERPSRCTTLPWSRFPKMNFSWKHFSSLLKQSPARRCGPIVYYSCSVRINILMRLKRDWKEPATAECLSLISLVIHNGLNGFHLANKARYDCLPLRFKLFLQLWDLTAFTAHSDMMRLFLQRDCHRVSFQRVLGKEIEKKGTW